MYWDLKLKEGKAQLFLKAIKDLQSLEDGEIKAIKKFGTKKDFKNKEENHFTAEPKELKKYHRARFDKVK